MPSAAPLTSDALPADVEQLRALLLAERARCQQAEARASHLAAEATIPRHNPNPILRLSASGELLYANLAARLLAEELRGTGPSRVRPQLLHASTQALRSGEAQARELAANSQHYLLTAVPNLALQYVTLYLSDVTAQRRAEQEVREQREFYETVLGHVPAVVAVLDPNQCYRYLNPYAEPDPQRRAARMGRTFAAHCADKGLPPALAVRRHRLFERAVRTRELVRWEEQWPAAAGQPPLYWLCFYQPQFGPDGVLRQVMCYGLDISIRRQAEDRTRAGEAAVQAQQAFTDQVLNLNPNLIYVRDAQANIVFQNEAMAALREQIVSLAGVGSTGAAIRPEEQASYAAADAKVLSTGQHVTTEDRLTLANGEVRWYQSVKCPLVLPDGTTQVLGVSTDITALKQAQHAAEAAATARENFLANMSHEIRTPLNGVLGMAALLAKTDLDEQQRSYAAVIQHSGKHLLNVVNDVLDMAKITSGKLEMEQTAFNLCEVMGHAVQPMLVQAEQKGIRIVGTQLRHSCPHPWVVGDPYRLSQVLINLVSNALKFTPAGGKVSIGGYFVSETADTLTTEFRVTDTGIGIAPDKLEAIFQEFTQAYADTTRQFGGTGLGLSISRALVEQMGGKLSVQSTVGQGSSFSFVTTLPKASTAARLQAQSPEPRPQTTELQGRRVLLVEDNAVNREVASLLLAGHGLVVDEAASGIEALALFEQARYDVVLMDIQMPGMNGLEATAGIRQHPEPARAHTPVLALTANAFRADTEKYLAAGMNDTLAKPFEETELLSKISRLIAGRPSEPAAPAAEAAAPQKPGKAPKRQPRAKTAAAKPYDLALLRETAQGSASFMSRILASFHANTPASIAELRTATAAADWPAVAALAHKLRPSLQLLGADGLVPWLQTLEAPDAREAQRRPAAEALAAGLEELLNALPQVLDSAG